MRQSQLETWRRRVECASKRGEKSFQLKDIHFWLNNYADVIQLALQKVIKLIKFEIYLWAREEFQQQQKNSFSAEKGIMSWWNLTYEMHV